MNYALVNATLVGGLLLVAVMAMGIAVTMTLTGMLGLAARRLLTAEAIASSRLFRHATKSLEVAGAAIILAVGVVARCGSCEPEAQRGNGAAAFLAGQRQGASVMAGDLRHDRETKAHPAGLARAVSGATQEAFADALEQGRVEDPPIVGHPGRCRHRFDALRPGCGMGTARLRVLRASVDNAM